MFDGYGVDGAHYVYLNGMNSTDGDHMRFLIYMETKDRYRIRTKATGRLVRMDPDYYVSSRFDIKDDNSLFIFRV